MQDTKERILTEALRLFAQDGYEAVSMRDIGKQLGITQSALYKHYTGKRDIFDHIVARMEQEDYARAGAFAMPQESYGSAPSTYREAALDGLAAYTLAQFRYWTEDAFAASFRRLLTLEQYRSPEQSARYQQYLSGGVIGYLTDLFHELSIQNGLPHADPARLALEFYAPVYMLMSLYDEAVDRTQAVAQVQSHIDRFLEIHFQNTKQQEQETCNIH